MAYLVNKVTGLRQMVEYTNETDTEKALQDNEAETGNRVTEPGVANNRDTCK